MSGRQNAPRPDPAERLAVANEHLVRVVGDLTTSEDWRRMLDVAAKFPTYSANNVLLIGVQRPDASRVAGIRAWNSLGRTVRKGEKGIAILAPCLYRPGGRTADHAAPNGANRRPPQREADFVRRDRSGPGRGEDWHAGIGPDTERPDRPEAETARRELRGFRVVHVFDVAQTEGRPLPDVDPTELTGPAPADLVPRLAAVIVADGYAVERGDCGSAYGYTDFATRTVRVRDDVSDAQAAKTLAHELGHIRADHEKRFLGTYATSVGCRSQAEVEAESIGYLITTAAGLTSDDYTVPYVAGWSGGNLDLIRDAATRVVATARDAIRDLDLLPAAAATAGRSTGISPASRAIGREPPHDPIFA
ncbi:MAG: ArdC-like ssDNA-binding domain-containing protein [Sporichthyaceae bacterium]